MPSVRTSIATSDAIAVVARPSDSPFSYAGFSSHSLAHRPWRGRCARHLSAKHSGARAPSPQVARARGLCGWRGCLRGFRDLFWRAGKGVLWCRCRFGGIPRRLRGRNLLRTVWRILQGSAAALEALNFVRTDREVGTVVQELFLRFRSEAPALLPELRDDLSDLFCLDSISQAQRRSESQAAVLRLAMEQVAQAPQLLAIVVLVESLPAASLRRLRAAARPSARTFRRRCRTCRWRRAFLSDGGGGRTFLPHKGNTRRLASPRLGDELHSRVLLRSTPVAACR